MGAARVRQRVVDVKVPHHKGGEGGFGESDQRGHCQLRCPFGSKILRVPNAKVREWLPEQVNPKRFAGDYIRPIKKGRSKCGLSQQVSGNIKGHLGLITRPPGGANEV